MMINVLWIDDEHESLASIKMPAKVNEVNLVPFKSLKGGLEELEKNYSRYDGVLLDAKILEDENDVSGTENVRYVHEARNRIHALSAHKKFEVFVLTGQAELFDDHGSFAMAFGDDESKRRVFKKGSTDELELLFKSIRKVALEQADTQLKFEYKEVFALCTDEYIGSRACDNILTILKNMDKPIINEMFNLIRKVVEDLFRAYNIRGLLPDQFVGTSISLSKSSKFLAGKHVVDGYRHKEETHLNHQIASNLKNILFVTQDGSHRGEVDKLVESMGTPYLIKSVFYQLLDVLIWSKHHFDSAPLTNNWEKLHIDNEEVFEVWGTVINHNPEKGYAFLKPDEGSENFYIGSEILRDYALGNDMTVKAEIVKKKDDKTGEIKSSVNDILY